MSFIRDPKRLLATLIAGVVGLIVLLDFGASIPVIDSATQLIISWAALLTAIALVIGIGTVAVNHARRVQHRDGDWQYSIVLLITMLLVIISGTLIGFVPGGYVLFPASLAEQPVRDLFRAVYQPLASSFLALLTFFSLNAARRALQRKRADALVILLVTICVLVVVALPAFASASGLAGVVGWVESFVALAGVRGILIGAAIGTVIAGVRLLLGFDQPFLDR